MKLELSPKPLPLPTEGQSWIADLNADLGHEYRAILTATAYAARLGLPEEAELHRFFAAQALSGLENVRQLSEHFVRAGIEPSYGAASFDQADRPATMLERAAVVSKAALARYAVQLGGAHRRGDRDLVRTLRLTRERHRQAYLGAQQLLKAVVRLILPR